LEKDLYGPLYVGTSDLVHPGSEVYAIGAPMKEELGQSVSKGIVSGYYSDDDMRFLQSDVAINPGNSGGPLLTMDGVVVGIAALKLRDAEGINFFIPIEEALAKLRIENATPNE
jgi:serine protease Do